MVYSPPGPLNSITSGQRCNSFTMSPTQLKGRFIFLIGDIEFVMCWGVHEWESVRPRSSIRALLCVYVSVCVHVCVCVFDVVT